MLVNFHLGDIIRKVREGVVVDGKPLTKDQLAKRVGIRPNLMGEIEKTGECRTLTLERIAAELGVTVSYLFDAIPVVKPSEENLCADPRHRKLQKCLDSILHSNPKMGEWIEGNLLTFHAALSSPPEEASGDPGELHDLPEPSVGVANRRSRSKHGWRG